MPARVWVGAAGVLFAIAGLVGIIIVLVPPFGRHDVTVLDLSQTALIIGTVAVGQAILSKHRITTDEAMLMGKDIGWELGFKEGRRHARPVVIDLPSHREKVENWKRKFDR